MKYKKIQMITLTICMTILIGLLLTKKYDYTVLAAKTGTVTANSLNVRTGPGTTYDILVKNKANVFLRKGATVNILEEEDGWYHVSFIYEDVTVKGYVLGDYVSLDNGENENESQTPKPSATVTPTKTPTPTKAPTSTLKIPAKITASALNVRKAAGTKSEQLTVGGTRVQLKKDQKVTILKETTKDNKKWYYVSFTFNKKTVKGYVLSDYIMLELKSSVKAKVDYSSSVKIRTGAGTSKSYLKVNNKVVSLKNKASITITKEVKANGLRWYNISFTYSSKKRSGYILADQVKFTLPTVAPTPTATVSPSVSPSAVPTPDGGGNVTPKPTKDPSNLSNSGTINTSFIEVKSAPSVDSQTLISQSQMVSLTFGHQVTVLQHVIEGAPGWYFVQFVWMNSTLYGYLPSDSILLQEGGLPSVTPTPGATQNPGTIMTDAEFEQHLNNQGFPESYKDGLRALHQQYPYWQFNAYQTGLDWNTVIANQSTIGKNLITNSKNIAWKSIEKGAYDWSKDKFIPFDGSTWVTASKQAIEYYMDPRNFLNYKGIFQFEALSYQSSYQTKTGVEGVLKNTALYNSFYTYNDSLTGQSTSLSYSDTFIKAAEYSGVSPYHLATRVKQEVVTGANSLSSTVKGTVPGFEGLYNFYNIGATHSTVAGGTLANALNYAKNGTTNPTTNQLYMIPWSNQYRAIVGGAYFIGSTYINRGQNTVYLQKFNVTPTSTYYHQYMANVEAANAEASKTYSAYSSMTDTPIVFNIPVYSNMPASPCPMPTTALNPNNWLKTLSIDGYSLTPTFKVNDPEGQVYTLIVDNSVSNINISATPVSSTATVTNSGYYLLNEGNNLITIAVTAQNGNVRNYQLNVVREAAGVVQ